jgi:uncharacterized membrane protein YhaH (DUF805 family)
MQKAQFWIPLADQFVPKGRLSRIQYFLYGIVYALVYFVVLFGLGMAMATTGRTQLQTGVVAVMSTIATYVFFCLDAKRLHDMNWPAFIAAILLSEPLISDYLAVLNGFVPLPDVSRVLPTVNKIWQIGSGIVGLIMLFGPGNKGANKYGPDPLRPPTPPIEVF